MKRFIPSVKQYSWVILVCLIIATIAGFILSKITPANYTVNALLFVNQGAPGTSLPGYSPSGTNIDAANNYAPEILSRKVMEYVYTLEPKLRQRHYAPDDLLLDTTDAVSTTAGEITVTAIASNTDDTVLIANAVVNGFAQYVTDQRQQLLALEKKNLQDQITTLNDQKGKDQANMRAQASTTTPDYIFASTDLGQVNQRLNAVEQQLNQLPVAVQGDVFVIQKAKPGDVASSSKGSLIIAAGAGVGLLLGIMILILMIMLDNRLRGGDRVKEKLGLSYLGGLFSNNDLKASPAQARGIALQQFTDLRVNLRLTGLIPAEAQAPNGAALLVTSPQVAEGKTTVAVGLAAAVARSGGTVVVVDGNLKNPTTHLAFGMGAAGMGLAGLLKGTGREAVDDVVQRSNVPGVWLLPAGATMEDATLLMEQKLPSIMAQLRRKADLVIIDGPSVLNGAEASLMASMVDGVAMVVDFRHDKIPLLIRAKETLTSLVHTPVGVIMNRLPLEKRNGYFATAVIDTPRAEKLAPVSLAAAGDTGNGKMPFSGNRNGNGSSNMLVNGNGNGNGQTSEPMIASAPTPIAPSSYTNMAPMPPALSLPPSQPTLVGSSTVPATPTRQGPPSSAPILPNRQTPPPLGMPRDVLKPQTNQPSLPSYLGPASAAPQPPRVAPSPAPDPSSARPGPRRPDMPKP